MRHPRSKPGRKVKQENVWQWLASNKNWKAVFEFLRPSGKVPADDVVEFFCDFYNRRAIPGRKAVLPGPLHEVSISSRPRTHQERLDIIVGKEGPKCDVVVFGFRAGGMFFGVILDRKTNSVKVHNWVREQDPELTLKVEQVKPSLV